MPLTKVKEKFQVTIPTAVRKTVRLAVGDILEATVKNHAIILKPKAVVERTAAIDAALAEGLEDLQQGRMFGPFKSVKAMLKSLHAAAENPPKKSKHAA
jgi:AbrB family looped-hinge helix DNA binding protein